MSLFWHNTNNMSQGDNNMRAPVSVSDIWRKHHQQPPKVHPVLSGKEAFRAVFAEHIEEMKTGKPYFRPVVIHEVEKMIACGDPDNGTLYMCPCCSNMNYVPHTCKSKICPSCGNLANMRIFNSIADRVLDVPHRQWVFTIPACIRYLFRTERSRRLSLLFDAAAETIRHVFTSINPDLDTVPGIISILHTFGRANNWVPHIHCIVTDGGLNKYSRWWDLKFLIYRNVRIFYQDTLLAKLSEAIDGFEATAKALKAKYPDGFVVNAPSPGITADPNERDACDIDDYSTELDVIKTNEVERKIKYTARYVGRPAFATSRLDSYDGQNVTFHYQSHVDNKIHTETLTAIDFIKRITIHIHEPHFRTVRYYGLYCRTNKECCDRLAKALFKNAVKYLYKRTKRTTRSFQSHWRGAMIERFNIDPCKCSECGAQMVPMFLRFQGHIRWIGLPVPRSQRPPDDLDISGAQARLSRQIA